LDDGAQHDGVTDLASDVKQGDLGDCWLLSAICVAATRPHLIEKNFVTATLNDQGVICLRFFKNGSWRAQHLPA
jgi:hypothetical protein